MGSIQQKLPVSYLLFTLRGRTGRIEYFHALLLIGCGFYLFHALLDRFLGPAATWLPYPVLIWSTVAVSSKRLHDVGRSGRWLVVALIPILGPLWLVWQLLIRRGNREANRFGPNRKTKVGYHENDLGCDSPAGDGKIINDVTGLNPVVVGEVIRPDSMEVLQEALRTNSGPVSVGGGRFSMGGQTASAGSLHIDMRSLNRVVEFNKNEKWIRVQAGIRWCDIQHFVDPHDLSVKIMQSYANFTVGGALSVNAHGRYVGLGPVVLSVRAIMVAMADGKLVRATRTENPEIFFAAIGGYSAIGIIVEAELDLADNVPMECTNQKMPRSSFADYFKREVRDDGKAVFHNGDIYPPHYDHVRAVTWRVTERKPTTRTRLMPLRDSYPVSRYFVWAFCETPFGHWRREYLIEPLLYARSRVHWRNYEAGYDVAELEPRSRAGSTYVLQEYFVPVANFDGFSVAMAEVLKRHHVKVLNISIRHSEADPGTLLAWAREEVFAFVIYHKQRTDTAAREAVAAWTCELIDAVLEQGGSYYLPYQVHATEAQFHRAYPRARELFALKRRLDPAFRFRHILWEKYYEPLTPSS